MLIVKLPTLFLAVAFGASTFLRTDRTSQSWSVGVWAFAANTTVFIFAMGWLD